jgi:uncharacterized membrane protein YtjA (UPF0391 family)
MGNQAAVRDKPEPELRTDSIDWTLLSAHGRVLFYIALCPASTVAEIARAHNLTERNVWTIVRDLRRGGMLRLRRRGRRHHYSINPDAPFRHPTLEGFSIDTILGDVSRESPKDRADVCE